MKKIITLLLLLLPTQILLATHGMGGEITWSCSGSSYVFKVKFYRDCNGIPGMGSVSLDNNAGVPSILCSLVSQTDISPTGSASSGNINCPTCTTGGNGAVEEFVYESAPTILPGTPPATGWVFWFGSCCRSNALTNLPGAGSLGFSLRAKMYPYMGYVAGQCNDNSPFFAEKPSVIICTGYPFTYNHNAVDAEMDSLVYSWDYPLEDGPYPQPNISFGPGYSVTSQMPGPIQNPMNVAAVINPVNGEISYTSFTSGYFATVIKVSTYKCGILAAEIWREINVVLIGGCTIPVAGNPPNNPPVITPPFLTGFDTTVYAGDSLLFFLPVTDPDPHPVLAVQSVTFNASGGQFGAGFINPNVGCLIPPCATLSPPPPIGPLIFGTNASFHWQTTPAHLGLNFGCVYFGNKYYFVLRANDNYCPANAIRVATICITVLPVTPVPLVNNNGGTLICQTTGNYIYQWFLNGFAVPGATSQSYTPVVPGFYQVLVVNTATGDGNYSTGITVTTVGIHEVSENISDVIIKPNPSVDGNFNLSFTLSNSESIQLVVRNIFGEKINEHLLNAVSGNFSKDIDLSTFSRGIYFLEIKSAEGSVVKKVVVM